MDITLKMTIHRMKKAGPFANKIITNEPLLFSNNYFLIPSLQINQLSSFFHSMNRHVEGYVLFDLFNLSLKWGKR